MTEKVKTQRASVVGLALAIGAGLGLIVGLLVGGGEWIAGGLAIGAGLGVVVGAAYSSMASKP